MASKPLSNDEAKNLMKQLGMAEASARDEDRVAKGGSSTSEASVAQLLSELYRSDIGRRPPHMTLGRLRSKPAAPPTSAGRSQGEQAATFL